jgi:hypothetical protein
VVLLFVFIPRIWQNPSLNKLAAESYWKLSFPGSVNSTTSILRLHKSTSSISISFWTHGKVPTHREYRDLSSEILNFSLRNLFFHVHLYSSFPSPSMTCVHPLERKNDCFPWVGPTSPAGLWVPVFPSFLHYCCHLSWVFPITY